MASIAVPNVLTALCDCTFHTVSALTPCINYGWYQAFTRVQGQGLKEMDMLVWLGDFNYRVDAEYGEAKSLVRRNDLSPLLSKVCIKAGSVTASPLVSDNNVLHSSNSVLMCISQLTGCI